MEVFEKAQNGKPVFVREMYFDFESDGARKRMEKRSMTLTHHICKADGIREILLVFPEANNINIVKSELKIER